MTRWGGEFLDLLDMNLDGYSYYQKQNLNGTPLTRTDGIMLIGMFIGCLVATLLANKVKFRLPASNIRIFQAIVGRILSGYVERLAFGCNLTNFYMFDLFFFTRLAFYCFYGFRNLFRSKNLQYFIF